MFGAGGLKVKEVKRQRQKSTDTGTHLTEHTLPQYRTNPSTPIVPQMPRTHAPLAEVSIPAALTTGEFQQHRNNPTFRLDPPVGGYEPSVASPTEVPIDQTRDSIHPESRRTSPPPDNARTINSTTTFTTTIPSSVACFTPSTASRTVYVASIFYSRPSSPLRGLSPHVKG